MAAAPLPSPTATHQPPTRYFNPPFPPTSSPLPLQHQHQHPQPPQPSDPASTSSSSSIPTSSQHASVQPSHHHQPQVPIHAQGPRGGTTASDPSSATLPFLRDFNLVAEAAKRAQMAVLMRDLEGVAL